MKIAICDDRLEDLQKEAAMLEEYLTAREISAEVKCFSHPDALISESEKTKFDLYLLDVVMPMLTGIDVGRELRMRSDRAQIIYLTTSDEFAVEAFSIKAAHYLLKPCTGEQFADAMERALAAISSAKPKQLPVKTEDGDIRFVDLDSIQYIESRGHTQEFHLKEGVFGETRRSLSRILEELERLSPGQFISPYKGYIVNFRSVLTIDAKGILLRCGNKILIPRGEFRRLQEKYVAYRFGQRGSAK